MEKLIVPSKQLTIVYRSLDGKVVRRYPQPSQIKTGPKIGGDFSNISGGQWKHTNNFCFSDFGKDKRRFNFNWTEFVQEALTAIFLLGSLWMLVVLIMAGFGA